MRPFDAGDQQLIEALAALAAAIARGCRSWPFGFKGEAERREFRTAAWLHDCGKIVTPEAVVEKATKLDAPFNRLHEIRTRFEVLLRDGRIARLEGLLAGGDPDALDQEYARLQQELQEDFACVARCNLGTEGTDPVDLAQLRRLAERTWWRHFDDRIGLGWEEQTRHSGPPPLLPARESLLSDAPPTTASPGRPSGFLRPAGASTWWCRSCSTTAASSTTSPWPGGTLTPEESYRIREHMIHTIVMLDSMTFPPCLARVAEIAGWHHETLDGRGYPRGLGAEKLSIPARILAGLRDRGRIDEDLFALFLRSGVYLT